MERTETDGILASIRKQFFALRNGMLADTLRKGGLEQKYIFGLQLPQIKEIALQYKPSEADDAAALARALWADTECREARLLACHLMPPALMKEEEAKDWADNVRTREEADILAFRLLRYTQAPEAIARQLAHSESPLKKYTATAIERFL